MYSPRIGDRIATLDTPSMIVDLDLMESNIHTLMTKLLPTGRAIRPHLKTTKSAILAQKLVQAGATGGCVAKVSEAEALAAAGFSDLHITSPIVGPAKVRRLVALFRRFREIRIVVDSEVGAKAIDDALGEMSGVDGVDAEEPIRTLIDLDVGLHRTGVKPGESAMRLIRYVGGLKHLKIVGVQGYEGHLQHLHDARERRAQCLESMRVLTDTAEAFRAAGYCMDIVTTGGTGTAEICASVPGVTELQPGSFIFMDTDYRNAVGSFYANSLTILSTVISQQGPRAVTIDAGLKSLSTDSGMSECKDSRYTYHEFGDEQGSLKWEDDGDGENTPGLTVGDRVEIVPSHIDPTVNLHDVYYAHRNGVIEEIWPVDSRGKVQ